MRRRLKLVIDQGLLAGVQLLHEQTTANGSACSVCLPPIRHKEHFVVAPAFGE